MNKKQFNKMAKFSRTISAQSLPPYMIDRKICQKNNASDGDESCDSPVSIYHSTLHMMANDISYQREVSLGKRVGFYRIGKELGSGNFSKVKLAIHVLTNGNLIFNIKIRVFRKSCY